MEPFELDLTEGPSEEASPEGPSEGASVGGLPVAADPQDLTTKPRKNTAETRRARQEQMKAAARDRFDSLVDKAIATVAELCEMGDSESVRLDAAKTILKMAEVDPGQKKDINVNIDDKRAVRAELEETLAALQRNNPAAAKALTQGPSIVEAEIVE